MSCYHSDSEDLVKKIPLVSFLDPVVSISKPVKLQSDNDADVANLKA